MAKPPAQPIRETGELLDAELRRRGMSDTEIQAALRKKKRRKALEFNAVIYPTRALQPGAARPSEELYTVEQAAGQLQLHPKTVLRFIRENRLKATRLGKSYRIHRADLDAFSGVPAPAAQAWTTSIVDVPNVSPALAKALARQVPGALNARPREGAPMRAEVVHDPERSHVKIVITGSPGDAAALLSLIRVWLEQP
jgi:excisionase family DNA binding protein